MNTRSALVLALIVIIACVSACGGGSGNIVDTGSEKTPAQSPSFPQTAEGEVAVSCLAFIEAGVLSVESPEAVQARVFLPWQDAIRVARFIPLSAGAAVLVNGFGFVLLSGESASGRVLAQPISIPEFRGRTLGSSFLDASGNIVALAYRVLSIESRTTGPEPASVILSIDPKSGKVSRIKLPLEEEKGFQITSILPQNDGSWLIMRKMVSADRVYLDYARYSVGKTTSLGQSEYMAAATSTAACPTELRELLRAAKLESKVSYLLCSDDSGLPHKTYTIKESVDSVESADSTEAGLREAYACKSGNSYYILDASEMALFERGGSNPIRRIDLPALPEGFSYGDFIVAKGFAYMTWEESAWPKAGRSGLYALCLASN